MSKNYNPTRHLLTALAFVLACATASAQDGLQFGVQISPTFSGMTTSNNLINRDGSNLGLKLGLIGEYYFSDTYSIHSGLGFHFNSGGTLFYDEEFTRAEVWRESLGDVTNTLPDSIAGGVAYKYDLQYLEIPLGLTLRTREFGYIRYYVRPALHLGILTQARGSVENKSAQPNFIDADENFDINPDVSTFNLSWSFGGGIEYSLSESTALIAGLYYQSGFADVTSDQDNALRRSGGVLRDDDSNGQINNIVIMLGIMF